MFQTTGIDSKGEPMVKETKKSQILALVRAAGDNGITNDEIKAQTGIAWPTVSTALARLRRDGLVEFCYCSCVVVMNWAPGVDPTKAKERFEALKVASREASKQRAKARDHAKYERRMRLGDDPTPAQIQQRQQALEKAREAMRRYREKNGKATKRVTKDIRKKADRAINRIAKQIKGDGTHQPRAPKPQVVQTIDWGNVKVQKIPHQPGRYEVLTAEPVFSGKPLLPASSCAARALGS